MHSLTIILAFNTFSFILYQIDAVDDLSRQWCQRTDFTSLCMQIMDTDPRNDLRSSPEGLCRSIVDKALIVSTVNIIKISDLVKKSTGLYNEILRDCLDGYNQAHDVLQHANLSVIDRHTYLDLAAVVSYPSKKAVECEEEFKQSIPSFPSPLTQENKLLEDIITVAMEIINFKVCNQTGVC